MSRHRFHVSFPRCGHQSRAFRGRTLAVTCRTLYRSDFVQSSGTKTPSMTRVRINYDGWLSLPTAVRQKLGLSTGDQLELELADAGIVLRPVRSGTTADEAAPASVATAEPSVPATPPAAAAAAPIVKRGPGRPRKTPLPVIPPTLKARGGRRKTATATEPRP